MIAPPQHVSEDWDVLVIGAGPAGTAAAAIIAEHGHRVLIVERDAFPRYRLGESLIPYCWHALNRLGMVEKLDAAACTVKKHSVQFVGLEGGTPTPFYFNQHTDEDLARTWQVVRSEFDRMMLDTALGRGAQVAFRATARELIRDGETVVGVRVEDADGARRELRSSLVIDASGRDLFSVGLNEWRVPDPKLKKIAMWTYFRGAVRDPGIDEGATTVAYLPDKGWF
ncbi:MAG: NAD(P)/FAD-dependent oxidoreductase, partial [Planctomycetota bacterium]